MTFHVWIEIGYDSKHYVNPSIIPFHLSLNPWNLDNALKAGWEFIQNQIGSLGIMQKDAAKATIKPEISLQ